MVYEIDIILRIDMSPRYYVTLSTGYEIDIILRIGKSPLQDRYDWNLTLSIPRSGGVAGRSRARNQLTPSANRASASHDL